MPPTSAPTDPASDPPGDSSSPAPGSQAIALHAGWNWFSIGVEPADTSLPAVLSSIEGRYDYVLSEAGTYSPGTPALNTFGTIEPGRGYMIRMREDATLTVTGFRVPPSTPLPLSAGWHWVGYLGQDPRPISQALSAIQGSYDYLLGETGTYAPPPAHEFLNTLATLEEGRAYLIKMRAPGTVVYGP